MFTLKEILAKDPLKLTAEEKAFLKEKASELSDSDKEKFADMIGDEELDKEAVKKLISKSIQDEITAKADEMSDNLIAKFFKGVGESRKKAIDAGRPDGNKKADDVTRKFMKALLNGDKATCKALTTSTTGSSPDDADAGLTIPTELMTEVLRLIPQFGLARRDMFYLPFSGPGNSRTIPVLGTSVSVFWTDQGAKKRSTQPKFSVVTQTLKKLAAIVPFTEEILEDSAIDLTGLIGKLFAEAVGVEEDAQFFAGVGAPWTGILNNGDVNKVIAGGDASQVTVDDLINMEDKTPTGALNGAKYYFHRTILSALRKLKDLNGNYILVPAGNGLPATLNGRPYETSDAFPALSTIKTGDQFILFGNLQQGAIFGDKQQLRIKLLDQATITDTDGSTNINLAEQDMTALRIVERVGYTVGLAKAMTVLEASATQS